MDIDADGNMDILSGTYSRHDGYMAGTFQVLRGNEDGTFQTAETLNGSNGEPLIIQAAKVESAEDVTDEEREAVVEEREAVVEEREAVVEEREAAVEEMEAALEEMEAALEVSMEFFEQNCLTHPFAVDWNGDSHLDLVVGNSEGRFYLFTGKGNGVFDPKAEPIMAGDNKIAVPSKSGPCVVDWDNDGDLDIVSGSGKGGAYLSINNGSPGSPRMTPFSELVEDAEPIDYNKIVYGDEHIKGPQTATRVWVEDVNEDGKLDLLIGDSVNLAFVAEGVEESEIEEIDKLIDAVSEEAQSDIEALGEKMDALGEPDESDDEEIKAAREALEAEFDAVCEKIEAVRKLRSEVVREVRTGHVWVYFQK